MKKTVFVDPFHQGQILNQDHLKARLANMLGDRDSR